MKVDPPSTWWAPVGLLAVIVGAIATRCERRDAISSSRYVLQITSFATDQHFYFPTKTPLVLFFLTAVNTLTRDPIWTIRIGSLILLVMLCLAVYAVITSVTALHKKSEIE